MPPPPFQGVNMTLLVTQHAPLHINLPTDNKFGSPPPRSFQLTPRSPRAWRSQRRSTYKVKEKEKDTRRAHTQHRLFLHIEPRFHTCTCFLYAVLRTLDRSLIYSAPCSFVLLPSVQRCTANSESEKAISPPIISSNIKRRHAVLLCIFGGYTTEPTAGRRNG